MQLQQQAEGKSPAAIKLREEISHVQKRKAMHAKSLDKVKGTLAPAPTLTLTLTLALALALTLTLTLNLAPTRIPTLALTQPWPSPYPDG